MAHALTVQILVQNSERTLRRALESVRWADEILVVDGGSTDSTLAIASEFGARVLTHPYENYGAQQNWALPQCTHSWVLVLDSDEWVSPGLAVEIRGMLAGDPPLHGYWVRRVNEFMGTTIRYSGWQNDLVLRLLRREHARFRIRSVASDAEIDGAAGHLRGVFGHEPYKDVADHVSKIQRYTTWGAQEIAKSGKKVTMWQVLSRPVARFLRGYVLRLGFLDGRNGLILAIMTSFYAFLKYLKALELQSGLGRPDA